MNDQEKTCCHKKKPWYKEPLYLLLILSFSLILLNYFLNKSGIIILNPFIDKFLGYLGKSWWAILLGILIGGIIQVFVPEKIIANLLARGKGSVFLAVILGFFASACSHGILAITVSLYKKGASTASTLAFLLAAPWANLAITLLLFSFFKINALFIIFGALGIALISGLIFEFLEKRGIIEGKIKDGQDVKFENYKKNSFITNLKYVLEEGLVLAKGVIWWVLLGFLFASLLGAYLPDKFMQMFFGPNLLGLFLTLISASLIEVCSEGSAPLAFELYEKTKAFGNAFVFLQAGVVTDFTEIGIVTQNIGKKAALAMVLVSTPLVLLTGFFFNKFI